MATNSDDSSTFNIGDTNTEIHKVAVKPPAFWRNKPKLWFLQLEAQFFNSATPAELLYGESIRLPCDFFKDTLLQPQSEFVQTLKATIKDFKPVPFSYHSKQKPFIFKDLKDCSHVFVRTGSVRRSLQPPYHGPYKVISRSDKVFTLFIKGKNVNVSIDRFKPCFSDNSSESDIESSIGEYTPNKPVKMPEKNIRFAPLPLPASTRATRCGRQVHLPVRYQ
ncbi:uncharacterized protein TNIN_30001 [Trichonephila inaurata madagascariensis]|uniref:Uncharacterized protein n=1 Tax=Trichonephila inaurata madagascariensis TaxID=2747483 RepID=A0A8X6WV43_9ARAC|nr:uncharacterized protein TNIN_30001 [Trichonephila inaurata madagascariensis]